MRRIAVRSSIVLLFLGFRGAGIGASAAGVESTTPPAGRATVRAVQRVQLRVPDARPTQARPALEWRKSALILSAGAVASGLGQAISISWRSVPEAGLDPAQIKLAVDRRVVGNWNKRAQDRSTFFEIGALVWPAITVGTTPSPEAGRTASLSRFLIYAEASALNFGLTQTLKHAVSRPRPYLYHAERDGPEARGPSPSGVGFESMPSGHASASFCAAAFASVDHLLSRPRAGWKEHALVGFVGGFLAGEAAVLRVRGGVHFPTDAVAGAGIGTVCGAGVPLLHRYVLFPTRAQQEAAPRPGGRSWLSAGGGMVVGAVLAVMLSPSIGGQ